MLTKILDILVRTDINELSDRFIELYNAAAELLSSDDQEVAKQALADKRLDNDEAHARLQAKLEEAKNR